MPRYDIVVHLTVDLDAASPEQAAEIFKDGLRAGVGHSVRLRRLALWRPHDGKNSTPLPAPLPEQLQDFFDGVAWRASEAEVAFRIEVEGIMADSGAPREAGGTENGH